MWLQGQIYECSTCNASYHNACWPKNDFCEVCQLMNDSLGFSSSLPASVAQTLKMFPQDDKILTVPSEALIPEA
jgi:hypothetical protein